jgi:beta-glucosidase
MKGADPVASLTFPDGFLWGVATSAHQIEGAVCEDGRGESIWDRMSATPGNIADGSTAEVACDHYHRWREDIELMSWLGVGAYRFSIAWPRVIPRGRGPANPAGLDFYDRLVDLLLDSGILPFVTLYHWDLPQALQDRGGWGSRDTVDAFVAYSDAVTRRLGDRVRHWATHNEPWCIATLGHEVGEHAPGHRDPAESLRAAHHVLLSHGRAVEVIRANAPGSEAGVVLNLVPAWPATPEKASHEAVRQFDGLFNRWYLGPIFNGAYPDDAIEDRVRWGHLEDPRPQFLLDGDLEAISAPVDFLGVNYYSRVVVRSGANGRPEAVKVAPSEEMTDMGWEVFPLGLYDMLTRLQNEYGPHKVYITENGAAYSDGPDTKGRVADRRRIDYIRAHVAEARRSIGAGVPLAGYFVWSLLDNFEWAHGYTKRFGLYWVEYDSQKRLPKDSAYWYRDLIAGNGIDGQLLSSSEED